MGWKIPSSWAPGCAVTLHFCLLGVSWAHCFLLPFDVACVREGSAALWAQAHTRSCSLAGLQPVCASGAWVCWGQAGDLAGGVGKEAVEKPQPSTELGEGREGLPQPTRALPPVPPDGEKGATTSLCLAEETEASNDPRGSLAGLWGSFSRLRCCCHLPALCVVPPSACALTNSRDTGLGTKSSRGSGWPGGGHAARPGSPRATIPTHTAAKAGTRLNTGPKLAL